MLQPPRRLPGLKEIAFYLAEADLDDYSALVDRTLRRRPGVTGIRSNLLRKEMKASNKLPVTSTAGS